METIDVFVRLHFMEAIAKINLTSVQAVHALMALSVIPVQQAIRVSAKSVTRVSGKSTVIFKTKMYQNFSIYMKIM